MAPSSIRDVTREVWASNLEEEMRNLRRLVDDFPYISMVRLALADETGVAMADSHFPFSNLGLRVSSSGCSTYREVPDIDRLPLPDDALQR